MKVLDAVISAGNVTKASKRLSETSAAVSIALTRLQLFYNEQLFVRGKYGLIPTVEALALPKTIIFPRITLEMYRYNPHAKLFMSLDTLRTVRWKRPAAPGCGARERQFGNR